jgi:hypothetical protein
VHDDYAYFDELVKSDVALVLPLHGLVKVRLLFFVGDLTRLDPFRAMSSTVSIIRVKRRMAGVCHPIAHAKRTRGSQLICMPNCMLLTAASQKVS